MRRCRSSHRVAPRETVCNQQKFLCMHLNLADEVSLLPIHEGQVPFPASQQQVSAAPSEGQVVWTKLRKIQVEYLIGCSDLCFLHNVFLKFNFHVSMVALVGSGSAVSARLTP